MINEFTIISNNCWGGEVYKHLNLPYNTPFVGLFIPPHCFTKLCNNLPDYLLKEIIFINKSKYSLYENIRNSKEYPIGLLGDIEIHFLHYSNKEEAKEKWDRRVKRMSEDQKKWRIKGCDREIIDILQFTKDWNQIPYKKIFFSSKRYSDIEANVWIISNYTRKEVVDGMSLFNLTMNYIDLTKWLYDGSLKLHYFKLAKFLLKQIKKKLQHDWY